jgi:aminoglycoside phosphotransferase (APT) family kinase protein
VAPPRMHADEIHTDAELVRQLLAEQFPEWAELPVEPVRYFGTDNAIYRLGDELAVRLPRRDKNLLQLEKELLWLPRLAPLLPLAIPEPVAVGEPGEGYPLPWAVYRWLDGEAAYEAPPREPERELAAFLAALRRIDPGGGPLPGEHNFFRGEPVRVRDEVTRSAIAKLGLDREALPIWEAALAAPDWAGSAVWIHGDLDARNLIVSNGRVTGVVDFGGLGVGDPACDVMAAWKVLSAQGREGLRRELEIDDATWARAGGWALTTAVNALTYYTDETNPLLVREARNWLAEVLADSAA